MAAGAAMRLLAALALATLAAADILPMRDGSASGGGGAEEKGAEAESKLGTIVVTQALLFCLFFGVAATVNLGTFKGKFREWRGIATGLTCQFLLVPALGFASCKWFELDPTLGITLIVLTSSPGGSYSNWWCAPRRARQAPAATRRTSRGSAGRPA